MKKYYREYELLQDLPTGEKKGDHFFFHVSNENPSKVWYKKGSKSEYDDNKWYSDWKTKGVHLKMSQMTEPFFKPIGEEKDFYPPFPSKEKISEYFHLIGENRLVNSVDEVRAISEIFYSDEFYNEVYNHLRVMYNEKNGIVTDKIGKMYPMCQPQLVQLDCRDTECEYHKNGECINVSPALTLINGKVNCWTRLSE